MATSRKRTCTRASGDSETPIPEMDYRSAMEELRRMREERALQQLRQEALATLLQRREEELSELRGRTSQLSLSNNRVLCEGGTTIPDARVNGERDTQDFFNPGVLGFKLKPDTYDGSAPLREFLAQFELISLANKWDDFAKSVALASSLRGKARSILDGVAELEKLSFFELKSKLEFRFGEEQLSQAYYSQFTNRKQKSGEDFVAFGAELERLARLAYSECSHELRDKIACAQFISALTSGFVKRTLQLENITSLKAAVQRAKAVKEILENNSNTEGNSRNERFKFRAKGEFRGSQKGKEITEQKERPFFGSRSGDKREKECWQCGAKGHFRFECPTNSSEKKGN